MAIPDNNEDISGITKHHTTILGQALIEEIIELDYICEGGTHFMHGRSLKTVGPRTPTMRGRSTSGSDRLGRHGVH